GHDGGRDRDGGQDLVLQPVTQVPGGLVHAGRGGGDHEDGGVAARERGRGVRGLRSGGAVQHRDGEEAGEPGQQGGRRGSPERPPGHPRTGVEQVLAGRGHPVGDRLERGGGQLRERGGQRVRRRGGGGRVGGTQAQAERSEVRVEVHGGHRLGAQ